MPTATTAPTDTPVPTDTATPEPTATPIPIDTPTATPTETETPTATLDLAATAAFEATEQAAAALEVVLAELETFNLGADSGELVAVDEGPFDIYLDAFNSWTWDPLDSGEVYDNFVFHVDVTWESSSGLAGCGVIFRSDDNLNDGLQYQFKTLRLDGAPLWIVQLYEFGRPIANSTGDAKFNSAIDQDNGATNSYTFVAEDGLVGIYANGSRLSNVFINSQAEGRFAFFTFQESGKTTCTFENIWIWQLNSDD